MAAIGADLLFAGESNGEASKSNTRFAVDLYRQLASENAGENLFFSPWSISGAMTILAEGARGETAEQIGRVLQLPQSARTGDASIPWKMESLHVDRAAITRSLIGPDDSPEARAARERIVQLRAELAKLGDSPKTVPASGGHDPFAEPAVREREIIEELDREREKIGSHELWSAGSLWIEKTFPFRQDFLRTVRKHYGPGNVYAVDFKGRHVQAREEINRIVARQTGERIKSAVGPSDIDRQTRLLITDTIYFRGEWVRPFPRWGTDDRDFTLADGQTIKTPIMTDTSEEFAYAAFNGDGTLFDTPDMIRSEVPSPQIPVADPFDSVEPAEPGDAPDPFGPDDLDVAFDPFADDPAKVAQYKAAEEEAAARRAAELAKFYPDSRGFAAVELPYRGRRIAMVLIAPNDPARLPAVEALLSAENLRTWLGHLKRRETEIELPRVKFDTTYMLGSAEPKPSSVLPAMGMTRAFNGGLDPSRAAQFGGIADSTDPLYITKVVHKASIEINERGTEATADPFGELPERPFIPHFTADRPFLFLIHDRQTGTVLFLGRVTKPN